ncbi:hypothetical protein ACWPKO_03045 [Coraliomargarita sp. W4R53]
MKNPDLVDVVAQDYYQRFGCNCTREEAIRTISKEQNVTEEEANESIMMIQGLNSLCYDRLKDHIQQLMSAGTEELNDPDLDPIFAGLPFTLSPKSKNEIIKYANWCISKG